MRIAAAVLALLAAASAGAVTIVPGDIASGSGGYCCCITCPPPPPTNLLTNTLASKSIVTANGAVAFAPGNRLYVTNNAGRIDVFDASLMRTQIVLTPPVTFAAGLAIAANGDLLMLASFDNTLHIYSPTGAAKQTFALPTTIGVAFSASFDLAPDQCTVFYIDGGTIGRRFNICTGQPLADLPSGPWNAVRALSDGGYIAGRAGALSIFDANDHLLRTLTPPIQTPWCMAFDSDSHYIWVGTVGGPIVKVQLENGSNALSGATAFWLAVNGEQRPATATLAADIPTLSPSPLFALALGLILLALQRLRA